MWGRHSGPSAAQAITTHTQPTSQLDRKCLTSTGVPGRPQGLALEPSTRSDSEDAQVLTGSREVRAWTVRHTLSMPNPCSLPCVLWEVKTRRPWVLSQTRRSGASSPLGCRDQLQMQKASSGTCSEHRVLPVAWDPGPGQSQRALHQQLERAWGSDIA